VNKDLYI